MVMVLQFVGAITGFCVLGMASPLAIVVIPKVKPWLMSKMRVSNASHQTRAGSNSEGEI